jgi:hypothetical protein
MRRINPTEERGPCGNKVTTRYSGSQVRAEKCSTLLAQALTLIHSRQQGAHNDELASISRSRGRLGRRFFDRSRRHICDRVRRGRGVAACPRCLNAAGPRRGRRERSVFWLKRSRTRGRPRDLLLSIEERAVSKVGHHPLGVELALARMRVPSRHRRITAIELWVNAG